MPAAPGIDDDMQMIWEIGKKAFADAGVDLGGTPDKAPAAKQMSPCPRRRKRRLGQENAAPSGEGVTQYGRSGGKDVQSSDDGAFVLRLWREHRAALVAVGVLAAVLVVVLFLTRR